MVNSLVIKAFIGKVKMNWPDWAEVTEVQMVLASTNEMKVISVEEGQTHIAVANLQEGVYIVRLFARMRFSESAN